MFSEFNILINRIRSTEERRILDCFHKIDADMNRKGLMRSGFPISEKIKQLNGALSAFNDLLLPKFVSLVRGLPYERLLANEKALLDYYAEKLKQRAAQLVKQAAGISRNEGDFQPLQCEFDSFIIAETVEMKNRIKETMAMCKTSESLKFEDGLISGWVAIQKDHGLTKRVIGKKLNFVKEKTLKDILFRDIEQAYLLLHHKFYKPAIIISGGALEEILKEFLKHNQKIPSGNRFVDCIEVAKKHSLFSNGIISLLDSMRDFRNLVHIDKERAGQKVGIQLARTAVSALFLILKEIDG